MLKCQKNKFWLEHIPNLVCSFNLVPLADMDLAEQMNTLTRLVIVVSLVLSLVGFRFGFLFLLLSLLFIIMLYYIKRKNMERFNTEHYTPQRRSGKNTCKRQEELNLFGDLTSAGRFCNDTRPLDGPDGAFNNPQWMSVNQKLAGPANPKTKIPPVVVPPPADLSYWRANNLVIHSAINEESNVDVYQSGYQVSTCCAPSYGCEEVCRFAYPTQNPLARCGEGYQSEQTREPNSESTRENFELPYLKNESSSQREGCGLPYLKNSQEMIVRPNESGQVNVACGYNPIQLPRAGLPTNLPAGNCPQDPVMKQYNENLFTQTIQPGVYTTNQINEPINSNMGISFTQQFPPTTCKTNPVTGQVNYTEHDPRIMGEVITEPNMALETPVNEANVYDPRFTGYGTSYRAYTDEALGQTRFYYDDVDAIRMPNYIVRSAIDNQPFADQYGPLPQGNANGNKFNADIRAMANDAFMTSAIQFRNDITERAMRKSNARTWQQRQAPISTSNQRMLGGMGTCK